MRQAVQELADLMRDMDTEIMCVKDFGLEFEGMSLDYVCLMENLKTKEKSVSFVNGNPEDKHSIWLNSEDVKEDGIEEFDALCEQICELD